MRPHQKRNRGQQVPPAILALLCALFTAACHYIHSPGTNAQPSAGQEEKDYVLVYSLPEKNDPLYASIAGYFNHPFIQDAFKKVVEDGRFNESPEASKLFIVGTADRSSRVRECLTDLGVELGERKVTIGGRSYALAPYAFAAQYESKGKMIALVAAAKYTCFNMTFDSLKPGTYQLLNADSRAVERGSVQRRANGWRLIPASVHFDRAFLPEQRAKEVETAVRTAAYIPSAPDDFRFVDGIAAGSKIFFIGEAPHFDKKVHSTVANMALYLRKNFGFGVMATETIYSLRPYFEARSLGNKPGSANDLPTSAQLIDYNRSAKWWTEEVFHYDDVLDPIADYNQSAPADKKLICTAADRDYIVAPNTNVVLYLAYLASLNPSTSARADLTNAISRLLTLTEGEDLRRRLNDVERKFQAAWSSFLPRDREEIAFTLSTERLSVDAQCASANDSVVFRAQCFRNTLEHAFKKARQSNGNLICHVGGEHAKISEIGAGDVRMGITEARYFKREYPPSKGHVTSLLIRRIEETTPSAADSLETQAIALMKNTDKMFVDLRHKSWAAVKNRPGTFFTPEGPRWDGVLFIK